MSLATRCPACGTVFRVVPDQLKVSDGWVRCGRCSDVFDASNALFDLDSGSLAQRPPAPTAAPMPPADATNGEPQARAAIRAAADMPPPTPTDASPADPRPGEIPSASPVTTADARADGSAPAADASAPEETAAPPSAAPGAPAASVDVAPPKPAPIDSTPADLARADFAPADSATGKSNSVEPAPSEPVPAEPASAEAASAEPAPAEPASAEAAPAEPATPPQPLPGFLVRAQQRQAARRRQRLPLALAAAALVLLLAGQIGLHFRDLIAVSWPATQPVLAAACRALGCELRAPLAIEQVSVESFTLRRIEGTHSYLLQLALRSRAPHDVRLPAIDLTLTDLQGRTLVRRMLDARDLGAAGDRLAPQRELTLQALVDLGELPVAGYTAELFYP